MKQYSCRYVIRYLVAKAVIVGVVSTVCNVLADEPKSERVVKEYPMMEVARCALHVASGDVTLKLFAGEQVPLTGKTGFTGPFFKQGRFFELRLVPSTDNGMSERILWRNFFVDATGHEGKYCYDILLEPNTKDVFLCVGRDFNLVVFTIPWNADPSSHFRRFRCRQRNPSK